MSEIDTSSLVGGLGSKSTVIERSEERGEASSLRSRLGTLPEADSEENLLTRLAERNKENRRIAREGREESPQEQLRGVRAENLQRREQGQQADTNALNRRAESTATASAVPGALLDEQSDFQDFVQSLSVTRNALSGTDVSIATPLASKTDIGRAVVRELGAGVVSARGTKSNLVPTTTTPVPSGQSDTAIVGREGRRGEEVLSGAGVLGTLPSSERLVGRPSVLSSEGSGGSLQERVSSLQRQIDSISLSLASDSDLSKLQDLSTSIVVNGLAIEEGTVTAENTRDLVKFRIEQDQVLKPLQGVLSAGQDRYIDLGQLLSATG